MFTKETTKTKAAAEPAAVAGAQGPQTEEMEDPMRARGPGRGNATAIPGFSRFLVSPRPRAQQNRRAGPALVGPTTEAPTLPLPRN